MSKAILFFSLLLVAGAAAAQPGKSDLEKERAAIQREMDAVKKSLEETKRTKKVSLAQLNQVQKKLQLRQKQISVINQQIGLIEGDINAGWRDITKLKKEVDTLKLQYEKSVVYSYKNRSNYDFINFIFSAGTFNDALKRVAYLKSYRGYREEQANNVTRTQQQLQQKITGLNMNREKKSLALKEQNEEKKELEVEKKEKDAVVKVLKTRESELNKELADKKKKDVKLANAIAAAIRRAKDEAIKEAAAVAKKNAAAVTPAEVTAKKTTTSGSSTAKLPKSDKGRVVSVLEPDAESRTLSDNFEKNRGSLPWPIAGNVSISMHFGPQTYEGLPVVYNNPGITIQANDGTEVKAVFDGEVTAVISIGGGQGVILQHGRFFTTYSNINSVTVSKGQQVKRGQLLGRMGSEDMEFLISNEKSNFDPEKWLR